MQAIQVMRPDRVKGDAPAKQETLVTAREAVQAGRAWVLAIAVGMRPATAEASRIAVETAAETWRGTVEARAVARFPAARFL